MRSIVAGIACTILQTFASAASDSETETVSQQITVTATRSVRPIMKTPASVTAVDLNQFNRQGVSNAGDVVRYEPGVTNPFDYAGADSFVPYRGGGFTNYRIRGVEGNRVLLTIDGIRQPPQFTVTAGGNGRDFFDPAVFDRLEILKGAGSTLHGSDALGGVVSFQTRDLFDELLDAEKPWIIRNRMALNEVRDGINEVLNVGLNLRPWYITVANSVRLESEIKNDLGDIDANPVDSFSNHLLAKATYSPTEIHRLTFTGEYFYREADTDVNSAEGANNPGRPSAVSSPNVYLVENTATDSRHRFSVDYEHQPDYAWWQLLEAQVYFQTSDTRSETLQEASQSGRAPADIRIREDRIGFLHNALGGQAQLTKQGYWLNHDHTLISGIEFSIEEAENDFSRITTTFPAGVPPFVQPEERPGFDPSDLVRIDGYLQDVIETGPWLFQGGVRLGYYMINPSNDPTFLSQGLFNKPVAASKYDNVAVSPSLAMQYELSPTTTIWGRYARGIRNPDLEDYVGFFDHLGQFVRLANPDLVEETSNSFDIGLKHQGADLEFELTGYFNKYSDFISIEQDSQTFNLQPQNIGEVDIYGVEARMEYRLSSLGETLNGFSLGSKLDLAHGRNKTDDDNVNAVNPMTVNASISYEHPTGQWGGRLIGIYRTKKEDVSRDYTLFIPPPSFVLDFTGYIQVTEESSIEFGIRNLLDRKYWIWPNTDSVDHAFNEDPELAVQPGINGFVAWNVEF